MTQVHGSKRRGKEACAIGRAVCMALALTLVSGGCTTVGMFGTGIPEPERVGPAFAGEDPRFPSLATVPERPAHTPTRQSERQRILRELQEDQAGAEFSPAPERPNRDSPPSPEAHQEGAAMDKASSAPSPAARFGVARLPVSYAPNEASRRNGDSLGRRSAEADDAAIGEEVEDARIPRMRPSEDGEPIRISGSASREAGGVRIGAGGVPAPEARASDSVSVADMTLLQRGGVRPGTPADADRSADLSGERIATIYFGHGSAELEGHDLDVLRQVARLHAELGGRLIIVGHASSRMGGPMDAVSHRIANLEMSTKRAEAVAEALGAAGVRGDAMRVEGRGDRDPVYHEFISTGEAGNRRVEIYLKDQDRLAGHRGASPDR